MYPRRMQPGELRKLCPCRTTGSWRIQVDVQIPPPFEAGVATPRALVLGCAVDSLVALRQ